MRISPASRVAASPVQVPAGPAPERYGYDLKLDPQHEQLQGTGSIELRNTTAEPLHKLYLRLWPNAPEFRDEGGSAQVDHVTVNGVHVHAKHNGTVLEVELAEPLAVGDRAKLAFSVDVKVPKVEDRFGKPDKNTLRIGNALPTLAVKDAEGWNLDPYVGEGESFYTLNSNWHVNLEVPTGWDVLSTGVTTSTHAHDGVQQLSIDAPNVRDFALAALRGYRMLEKTVDGTKVRVAADDSVDNHRAQSVLETTAQAVHFYNQRFGPYGAPELDVITAEGWDSSGMEYPGLVIDGVKPGKGETWLDCVSAAAHETAHQWFYGIVGNNQFDASWLDESFASFATSEFFRTQRPGDIDPNSHKLAKMKYRISAPRADAIGDGDKYSLSTYRYGARMLADLRTKLGEQTFDTALRSWVADNRGGIVTGPQFVRHMSAAAGHDLTQWFDEHGVRINEPGTRTKLDPNMRVT